MRGTWILTILLLSAFVASCSPGRDTVPLRVAGYTFQVEIADSEEERRQGLMNRESLPEGHGMLFVFPEEDYRSFWMKDTSIPLSIAFISADGVIREIRDMEPFSRATVDSRFPAKYALEVNRGALAARGIRPGTEIILPEPVRTGS